MLPADPVNQTERLYKIEQMLSESGAVPIATMLERLEISRATFKRDLDYLRDRLHAPIIWDRGQGGYRFDGSAGRGTRAGPKHELPGLWFNTLSPQRLVNYRGSWYVDAWCHLRNDLRSFSVDSIRKADVQNDRARAVAEKDLKEYFETSYGIFRGKATKVAMLRFTPERSRWVAGETWHAQQKGSFEKDGRYVLEVPYHDDRELVMDVLRHGAEVVVLAPAELRRAVLAQARAVLRRHDGK